MVCFVGIGRYLKSFYALLNHEFPRFPSRKSSFYFCAVLFSYIYLFSYHFFFHFIIKINQCFFFLIINQCIHLLINNAMQLTIFIFFTYV